MNRSNQSLINRVILCLLVIFLLGYSNIGYCKTSSKSASAAGKVLRNPNSSKDAKSAAGSALSQRRG